MWQCPERNVAARDLGLTPSAVSRQIGHLEDRLGTRLLNRSTRKVSLTMVGTQFYKRCVEVDRNVTDAEVLVVSLVDHPQGGHERVLHICLCKISVDAITA